MSDPFLGEIRLFAFAYAPQGWALCNGAILNVSQYQALYALIGNYYGGTAPTTFALPDFRGRAPLSVSSQYNYGATGGFETAPLTTAMMPMHTHAYNAASTPGSKNNAGTNQSSVFTANGVTTGAASVYLTGSTTNMTVLDPSGCSPAGGGQPHANIQPSIVLNFCIATSGLFPMRN